MKLSPAQRCYVRILVADPWVDASELRDIYLDESQPTAKRVAALYLATDSATNDQDTSPATQISDDMRDMLRLRPNSRYLKAIESLRLDIETYQQEAEREYQRNRPRAGAWISPY